MFLDHLSSPSTFFTQLSITTSISFWDWLDSLKLIHLKACLTSLPWDDNSTDSFECLAFCVWGMCVFRYGGSHVSAGACGDFRLMLAFSWIVSYLIWCGRVSGWAQNVPFWFVWLVSLLLSPLSLPPKSWDDMWLPQALFFVGVGAPNLGPHTYMGNTLQPEPYPLLSTDNLDATHSAFLGNPAFLITPVLCHFCAVLI